MITRAQWNLDNSACNTSGSSNSSQQSISVRIVISEIDSLTLAAMVGSWARMLPRQRTQYVPDQGPHRKCKGKKEDELPLLPASLRGTASYRRAPVRPQITVSNFRKGSSVRSGAGGLRRWHPAAVGRIGNGAHLNSVAPINASRALAQSRFPMGFERS